MEEKLLNQIYFKEKKESLERLISEDTSIKINNILRKVVTEKEDTAKLASIHSYFVGGKTGTSQNYKNKSENLNTFISIFPPKNLDTLY